MTRYCTCTVQYRYPYLSTTGIKSHAINLIRHSQDATDLTQFLRYDICTVDYEYRGIQHHSSSIGIRYTGTKCKPGQLGGKRISQESDDRNQSPYPNSTTDHRLHPDTMSSSGAPCRPRKAIRSVRVPVFVDTLDVIRVWFYRYVPYAVSILLCQYQRQIC